MTDYKSKTKNAEVDSRRNLCL